MYASVVSIIRTMLLHGRFMPAYVVRWLATPHAINDPYCQTAFLWPYRYVCLQYGLCQNVRATLQSLGRREPRRLPAWTWRGRRDHRIHCQLSLSLLPASDIPDAVSQIQQQVNADSARANGLQQLISHVLRRWICERSVGRERGDHSRTNNVRKSYHSAVHVPWAPAVRYLWPNKRRSLQKKIKIKHNADGHCKTWINVAIKWIFKFHEPFNTKPDGMYSDAMFSTPAFSTPSYLVPRFFGVHHGPQKLERRYAHTASDKNVATGLYRYTGFKIVEFRVECATQRYLMIFSQKSSICGCKDRVRVGVMVRVRIGVRVSVSV